MEAQQVDNQATALEMDINNTSLYLLAGKQALRIDLLESALTGSEQECRRLRSAIAMLEEQNHTLSVQGHEMSLQLEAAKAKKKTTTTRRRGAR